MALDFSLCAMADGQSRARIIASMRRLIAVHSSFSAPLAFNQLSSLKRGFNSSSSALRKHPGDRRANRERESSSPESVGKRGRSSWMLARQCEGEGDQCGELESGERSLIARVSAQRTHLIRSDLRSDQIRIQIPIRIESQKAQLKSDQIQDQDQIHQI